MKVYGDYLKVKNPAMVDLVSNQGQMDRDGISVAVSRQALDETLELVTEGFKVVKDCIPILDVLIRDREDMNGEEDEIARDLRQRCEDLIKKVETGGN